MNNEVYVKLTKRELNLIIIFLGLDNYYVEEKDMEDAGNLREHLDTIYCKKFLNN